MAADQETLRRGAKATAALLLACLVTARVAAGPQPPVRVKRIVSLVPNVTEMIYAIGAGSRMVAVSSYDTYPPEVKTLPNVGALLDPNVERILALKPDLVIAYGSQTDLQAQLARAGIGVFSYRHAGLDGITATIREVGARLDMAADADAVARRIERGLDDVRQRVKGRPRPRTLLVFGRERLSLRGIYVSGGVGFLHDMLDVAGGVDVFADVKAESVQATTEQIIARRPDVILETRAANSGFPSGDRAAEIRVWNALASVPAVRNGRVLFLFDDRIVVPGPRVVEGTIAIAQALHPDVFRGNGAERSPAGQQP